MNAGDDLAAAVAAYDDRLKIVWRSSTERAGGPVAIVRHAETRRLYAWPELTAWFGNLPSEQVAPLEGQLSLF